MTTNSFRKAILKAVNLGLNTTVIGSLTGALCGLYYGLNEIPSEWVINLLRHDDIEKLAENLYLKID
jgi:ADP-ribosylglycohydrolase